MDVCLFRDYTLRKTFREKQCRILKKEEKRALLKYVNRLVKKRYWNAFRYGLKQNKGDLISLKKDLFFL